ncbi:unnamed protein product [Somion occarium]|uniref:Uncharacterized protein n=1 Tax=Somion occarium TaxID=3059160 RepID=A0ABP1E094_9APHY
MSDVVDHFRLPFVKDGGWCPTKSSLGCALAHSRQSNARNIEPPWYIPWYSTLHEATSDIPNALLAPQFPLWTIRTRAGRNDGTSGKQDDTLSEPDSDNEDVDQDNKARSMKTLLDKYDLADSSASVASISPQESISNISRTSGGSASLSNIGPILSARTEVVKNTSTRSPDYCVLVVDGEETNEFAEEFVDFKILQVTVGLLVENKRYIRRHTKVSDSVDSVAFRRAIENKMIPAQRDLLVQAAHVFLSYPHQDVVHAIASVGPYWTHSKLERIHVERQMHQITHYGIRWDPAIRGPIVKACWTKDLLLGTPQSRAEMQSIHLVIENLAWAIAKRMFDVNIKRPQDNKKGQASKA